MAVVVVSCALPMGARAQIFTPFANFDGTNGAEPLYGSMVQATDGNFYGATSWLGERNGGTIFRLTPTGRLTAIYSFCAPLTSCDGGSGPWMSPILGNDGNLYGTANGGGTAGEGTIYRLTIEGEFTTLYNFCRDLRCLDGALPVGLIQSSDGSLYGTTSEGGEVRGVFFKFSLGGHYTRLYSFCSQHDCTDGATPLSGPIQGVDGNFYGTTFVGGSQNRGVVYEITPTGSYQVLYNFCSQENCSDGGSPYAALVQDAAGNLYGAATSGGIYGAGTLFQITPSHQFILLHSFDKKDGALPVAALTLANDGNLYGVTFAGGPFDGGTTFQITPSGQYSVLSGFCNVTGCYGYETEAPLLQATNGILYGPSYGAGAFDDGMVYTLDNNLSPLAEAVPTMGKVGTRVIVLGNNLTGSSSVMFNGVPAAFTVESDTYIKATVPTGATTGTVSVVTPSGMLNSNPQFVVTE